MGGVAANLFIAGMPRSGTTSLAKWLGAHPDVTVSRPKEPGFYIDDLPMANRIGSMADYERTFRDGPDAAYRLDATPWYLFSATAMANIAETTPDAQVIVQLRNPADQLTSLHRHHLKTGFETEPDLERALFRPRPTDDGDFRYGIDYLAVGRFGEQVARLLSSVDRERVIFVDFAELAANPSAVYDKIVASFGLATVTLDDFDAMNRATKPRSASLDRFIKRTTGEASPRVVRSAGLRLSRLNAAPTMTVTPESIRRRVVDALDADMDVLAALTGWDLTSWR